MMRITCTILYGSLLISAALFTLLFLSFVQISTTASSSRSSRHRVCGFTANTVISSRLRHQQVRDSFTLISAATTTTSSTSSSSSRSRKHLVVIGDDLSSKIAAMEAAGIASLGQDVSVSLYTTTTTTTNTAITATSNHQLRRRIWIPDTTLNNRQLLDRYASGGRELAGILSRFTPRDAQRWLQEEAGFSLEEVKITSEETSLRAINEDIHERLLQLAEKAGVDIQYQPITKIRKQIDETFLLYTDTDTDVTIHADAVILTGNDIQWEEEMKAVPTSANKSSSPDKKKSKLDKIKQDNLLLLETLLEQDEQVPLSRKERAELEKKQKQQSKKKLVTDENANLNDPSLSKREAAELRRNRKLAAKKKKKKIKNTSKKDDNDEHSESTPSAKQEDDNNEGKPSEAFQVATSITFHQLAQSMGHSITTSTKESIPSMFTFKVKSEIPALLKGCSLQMAPQARIRCKLPQGGSKQLSSSPKYTGPLVISKTEVSGSGALRLSALMASDLHGSNYAATLHIHFVPDIGAVKQVIELLQDSILEEPESPLVSECPLKHVEVDYEDYDMETGDFRRIVQPLVPPQIWQNLCQHVGIGDVSASKVTDHQLEALARLMVDFPVTITGICPYQEECVDMAGIQLKEMNMCSCESNIVSNLYVCGNALAVNGYDGGFNSLASLATGRTAGRVAAKTLMQSSSC